jgi:acyl-CoA synthetase (AMP-forming)/AMP-acid ligase II
MTELLTTAAPGPDASAGTGDTLATVLARRAADIPDATAYVLLANGEDEAGRTTFAELEARVRAVAAGLRERCEPGDRALLLFPAGEEFAVAFYACAYAGVVAVATQPPEGWRLGAALARIEAIVENSEPRVVMSERELAEELREKTLGSSPLQSLPWMLTDAPEGEPADDLEPIAAPGDPAFIQYTSGSTGAPKGVTLSHANLLAQGALLVESTAAEEGATSVSWAPLFHDMGLITAVVLPVYAGMRCVLMSPLSFLQKPARWLRAIGRYGASFSGGPTFAYEQCCRRVGAEERAELELDSWRCAFIGAEPIRVATVERFASEFEPAGFDRDSFWASWGLAESACVVTGSPAPERFSIRRFERDVLASGEGREAAPGDTSAHPRVGCGRSIGGHETLVVDPERREPLPQGRIGELWVRGPSVALGYWGQPELTEEVFGARLSSGDGPFLRTGDLGFEIDGELFISGRIKDLVIVRGRNIAPQDLEQIAEASHAALRKGAGAAFAVHDGDAEQLVIVQELERSELDAAGEALQAIRKAVTKELAVSPARIVLAAPKAVPKTSSGKIQRQACRARLLDGELRIVEERTWPS